MDQLWWLVNHLFQAHICSTTHCKATWSLPQTPAEYHFQYDVKDDYSGNDYTHSENRDGYNTQGQYQVLLPDGRIQTVEYTVTREGGFQANVVAQGVKSYA